MSDQAPEYALRPDLQRVLDAATGICPACDRRFDTVYTRVQVEAMVAAYETALEEAEAIMGGEYGDHFGPFAEMVMAAREAAAAVRAQGESSNG